MVLSPLESNANVVLGGHWWDLRGENVRLTVEDEDDVGAGTIVGETMLWAEAQTGQRGWRGVLGEWAERKRAPNSTGTGPTRPTLVFEKI